MHGFRAVPRRQTPAVVTIDSGTRERRRVRFVNLIIRVYREWEHGLDEEPVRYRTAS
jgi:hypothetical protein